MSDWPEPGITEIPVPPIDAPEDVHGVLGDIDPEDGDDD